MNQQYARRRTTPVFLAVFAMSAVALPAHAGELEQLVERADKAFLSKTSAAVFDMEVKTASYERSYKIVSWDDRRGDGKTLVKILGPAMWRSYGTLKIGNQLQLYNPKTNHVSVVSSSMLGDSWMGSHFTNDDLVHETDLADDFNIELIEKQTKKSPLGADAVFYRVRLTPKPTAPVAWGMIVYELFDDGEHVLPISAEYWRKTKDKKPTRAMNFTDFAELGGRTVPTRLTITVTDKPGEYTRITYTKIKYDVAIPGSKFSEQALRK